MVRFLKIKAKTFRASPARRCIYCGESDGILSEEHAVPFALGGRDVIPDASCELCRRITAQFEAQCLRGFLHDYRTASGFPTRRKKELRQTITQLRIDGNGIPQHTEVDASAYPRYLVLPLYPLPGLLIGREPGTKVACTTQIFLREVEARAMHGTVIRQKLKLHSFLRMIAKIGHSMAVARCGFHELARYETLLPKVILTKESSIYDVVGSHNAAPIPRVLHAFNIGTVIRESTEYLTIGIQLFANMRAPRYLAVVGKKPIV